MLAAKILYYIHVNKKIKIMTYEFFVHEDRVPFLVKELKNNITVGDKENSGMILVTVKIEYNTDVLNLFHAEKVQP
jgi:hypothetical protein